MHWTSEQILAMAPDASSAKSGQGLASPRHWVTLGRDEQSAWGECRGSAKLPYQAQIDLGEPAFRCTCPSRKFPCKHTLGLFLLLSAQPAGFTAGPAPEWVESWRASRAERAEKAQARKKDPSAPAADPAAQVQRAADRHAKVSAGLQELDLWLRDLVRRGFAAVQGKPYAFWEGLAARMVDAQAPGVAREIREMAGIPASGADWPSRLLEALSRLTLLVEGYGRLESLAPPLAAELRSEIGWTQSQEQLLTQEGLRDRWLVLGQRTEKEESLRVQRTWLWGARTLRRALVLDFAFGQGQLDTGLVPGTCLEAELVYYPAACPLRAVVKTKLGAATPLEEMPGPETVREELAGYAGALGQNPWLQQCPFALRQVWPLPGHEVEAAAKLPGWHVRDSTGSALPLSGRFQKPWELLALSGGWPVDLFGEWDGQTLLPLAVWAEGRYVAL